jgi:hypothetical protein
MVGENSTFEFVVDPYQPYGGTQSVKFDWYLGKGAVVQGVGNIDSGNDYQASVWMRTDSVISSNDNHINPPVLNAGIWSSPTVDGTYSLRASFFSEVTNTLHDTWQQFSGAVKGKELVAYDGEFMQIRFEKPVKFTSNKQWIDEAVLKSEKHIPLGTAFLLQ